MPRITVIHSRIDPSSVHIFRNFGEDLYREGEARGQFRTEIDDVDAAVDTIYLETKTRLIGQATGSIKKLLKAHHLDSYCEVTVSNG